MDIRIKKDSISISLHISFCIFFGTFSRASDVGTVYGSGIVVRAASNFDSIEDVDRLVDLCAKYNISSISLSFKQDEDDELPSGTVFYRSKIAPVAKSFTKEDLLKHLVSKAKSADIKVKAWIPQFHDLVAYKKEPSWQMKVAVDGKVVPIGISGRDYFVNPIDPKVQEYQLSIIEEIIKEYEIDEVVLDWIRFDDFNMDLGEYTRKTYLKVYGYDPLEIDFSKDSKRRREWNLFRAQEIAKYIKKVRERLKKTKPDLKLGVYILSPAWRELAQDPSLFDIFADTLYPMSYFDDWGYPVEWVYGKREDAILPLVKKRAPTTEIVPVFDIDWEKKTYEKIFCNLPQLDKIEWFHYGRWGPEEIERVAELSSFIFDCK